MLFLICVGFCEITFLQEKKQVCFDAKNEIQSKVHSRSILKEIFVSYFVLIVIFTLISFMIYSEKINRSRKSLMKYHRGLNQLIRIYDEEKNGIQ